MPHTGPLLSRKHIEVRLAAAWAAQQHAELIGDTYTAGRQRSELDALLDALLPYFTQAQADGR